VGEIPLPENRPDFKIHQQEALVLTFLEKRPKTFYLLLQLYFFTGILDNLVRKIPLSLGHI